MEGVHSSGELSLPQLLDLIPNRREWMVRDRGGGGGGEVGNGYSPATATAVVEKQLELRLGPPGSGGGNDDLLPTSVAAAAAACKETKNVGDPSSLLSLGLFSARPSCGNPSAGAKRGFLDTLEDSKRQTVYPPQKAGFFGVAAVAAAKEVAAHKAAADGGSSAEKQQHQLHRPASAAAEKNRPQQSRTTPQAPVVGWPPVRSFRKNIAAASSSSKPPPSPSSSTHNAAAAAAVEKQPDHDGSTKCMLVKINMDGVPIGRKVDLGACSGYDRLSAAADRLFRGLLAAQRVLRDDGVCNSATAEQETPAITGLLDGSGEYTLVYEDNEGDRILVGDVPWEMFVSTVKRLRVLKTSELPSLSLGVSAGTKRKAPRPRESSTAAANGGGGGGAVTTAAA